MVKFLKACICVIVFLINITSVAQTNKKEVDFCIEQINNKLVKYTSDKQYIRVKFSPNNSFYKTIFSGNHKPYTLDYTKIKDSTWLPKGYVHYFYLAYDVIFDDIVIYSTRLECQDIIEEEFEFIQPIFKNLNDGKLIHPKKAIEIAQKNGFKNIISICLEDDPRWKLDYEARDEKEWKITYTIKEKQSSDIGYDVLKIDAKNGEVLSKYIEHPID